MSQQNPYKISIASLSARISPAIAFGLILLLALGLRLLLWAQPLHQLANDEVEYVTVAYDLLAGRGWSFYEHYHWLRAPLYPLFLAGSLWLAGGDLHLAALPNLLLSVGNVALVAALAHNLAGRRAALTAASMMALLWTNVTFASLYMLETLFTFLFSSALLILVRRPISIIAGVGGQGAGGRRSASQRTLPATKGLKCSALRYRAAVASGLLFGLAALTRSAVLPFLALVFMILLWQSFRRSMGIRPALAFALSIALVLAPWTLRNLQAYARPILIETGLSYNLWAFNEPRESLDEIQAVLEKIPNPAERSDYATARGLQRLREDPLILARKLWPNWVFLARIKPIQDRFLQESYYSSIDLPLFSAALVFDDLLYVLIVLAAIWGLGTGGLGIGDWGLGTGGRGSGVGGQGSGGRDEGPEGETQDPRPKTQDSRSQASQESRTKAEALQENKNQSSNLLQCFGLTWVFVVMVTILLTHGEARYRHFLFPVLIPYAAGALTLYSTGLREWAGWHVGKTRDRAGATEFSSSQTQNSKLKTQNSKPIQHSACNIVLSLIFLWTILTSYPYEWASQNLTRGWYTMQGDIARRIGQPEAALSAYRHASDAQRAADPRLRLGDTARALGDTAQALDAYQSARRISPLYEASTAKLGDFLRAQGDDSAARAAFNADYVDQQRLLDWSWRELGPEARSLIDIGAGLDYGYITGVYAAEQQQGINFRWTEAHTLLRLNNPAARQLSLRLTAPRPDKSIVPIAICIKNRCTTLILSTEWRIIQLQLPVDQAQPIIELRSPTYQANGRELGMMIDWVLVR